MSEEILLGLMANEASARKNIVYVGPELCTYRYTSVSGSLNN